MIESITFNTAEKYIAVTFWAKLSEDAEEAVEVIKNYKDAVSYLADWPEREADIKAMGW